MLASNRLEKSYMLDFRTMTLRECRRGREEGDDLLLVEWVKVVESPPYEGSITRIDTATAPAARVGPTTSLMWESFHAMMHTMVATQEANSSQSTRGARCLWDFKRYDPRTFSGIAGDPEKLKFEFRQWRQYFC